MCGPKDNAPGRGRNQPPTTSGPGPLGVNKVLSVDFTVFRAIAGFGGKSVGIFYSFR